MKPEKMLVFIPAYNCEKQVPRVLEQLLDPKIAPWLGECIVVNNRATDGTEAAVQRWMAAHPEVPVTLLRNDENYGLGGSHKVAFGYAAAHGYGMKNLRDVVARLGGEMTAGAQDRQFIVNILLPAAA